MVGRRGMCSDLNPNPYIYKKVGLGRPFGNLGRVNVAYSVHGTLLKSHDQVSISEINEM